MIDAATIGSNVRYWRKHRGLTTQQVAARTGRPKSRAWLSRVELGHARQLNPLFLYEWADALEIPFAFLFRADAGDPFLYQVFTQARSLTPHNRRVLLEVLQDLQRKSRQRNHIDTPKYTESTHVTHSSV